MRREERRGEKGEKRERAGREEKRGEKGESERKRKREAPALQLCTIDLLCGLGHRAAWERYQGGMRPNGETRVVAGEAPTCFLPRAFGRWQHRRGLP